MTQPVTLLRAVSRWQIVGLSINDVVGSGIYLLPAAAAALLGPASVWAILLAGFAVALIVLCYAQASSYFDQPGGAYLYTREAFGGFIGFEVGWMTWLTRISTFAALANALALALAITGSFVQLALLSVISRLFAYVGTAAAVLVLRPRYSGRPGALRLPGRNTIPVCALLVSLLLLSSAGWQNLAAATAALAAGAVIYAFRRKENRA